MPRSAEKIAEIFAFDARSLEFFRRALGVLVATDVLLRRSEGFRFHGASGLVDAPYRAWQWLAPPWPLSLPSGLADSSAAETTAIFAILIASGMMIAGWLPRLATLAAWVLLSAQQDAAPLLNYGADHLLRLFLLWSLFLPGPKQAHTKTVGSVATAALMIQAAMPYIFAGIYKWNDTWLSGTGLELSLAMDTYTRPLAANLRELPALLSMASRLFPAFEIAAGIGLLLPMAGGRIREACALLLAAFHLGAALVLHTGLFPLVSLAGLVLFVPSRGWDALEQRLPRRLSKDAPSPGPEPGKQQRGLSFLREGICGALLLIMIAWNLAGLGLWEYAREHHPEWTRQHMADQGNRSPIIDSAEATSRRLGLPGQIGSIARLHQRWDMFAVVGKTSGGWPELEGTTASGRRIDLVEWRALTAERTPPVTVAYPGTRWRTMTTSMRPRGRQPLRCRLTLTRARQWNRDHPDDPVVAVSFAFVEPSPGQGEGRRTRRWITLEGEDLAPNSGACAGPP